MKKERASITAGIVAATRSLGALLRPEAQLAHDPYGAAFAGNVLGGFAEKLIAARKERGVQSAPLAAWILYMQVRTRALDDVLLEFVASGGRQVVLLGAGYDCRAWRFGERLKDVVVYEVDHPATQRRKRERLEGEPSAARVEFVTWDFEAQPVSELPAALARIGHRPAERTLTIWEGVTMYLSEPAIDATVAAVRAYSAPGSLLALTYFERRLVDRPSLPERVVRAVVKSFGEPFTWGWDRGELEPWLAKRGFALAEDRDEVTLAEELLPAQEAAIVKSSGRHVAVARRI